jgi:hypothetical protein
MARPPAGGDLPEYCVKGNVYLGTKAYFEEKVPGGLETLYGAIREPELLAFLQQKFLTVAWYDVLPAVPLIRAEARAVGLSVRAYLEQRSAYQAEHDLSGVYRFLLQVVGTENVALRLPRVFVQIFNFGSSEMQLVEPGYVAGYIRDFPNALYEWFSTALPVYATTALHRTGARDVTVTARRAESTLRGSLPLASLSLEFRWRTTGA